MPKIVSIDTSARDYTLKSYILMFLRQISPTTSLQCTCELRHQHYLLRLFRWQTRYLPSCEL